MDKNIVIMKYLKMVVLKLYRKEERMIGFIIGIILFVVGVFMFIFSLIKNWIKKDSYNTDYLIWCIILNVGNIIVQISNVYMKYN